MDSKNRRTKGKYLFILTLGLMVAVALAVAQRLPGIAQDPIFTPAAANGPGINNTEPAYDQGNVSIYQVVSATFDTAMNPATINGSTFTLQTGGSYVEGTVTYNGVTNKAKFDPVEALAYNTTYTATLTTEITDSSGRPLANNYTWSFTTEKDPDAPPDPEEPAAPYIIFTDPRDGDVDIPIEKVILAEFSEVMDPATINESTFLVSDGENLIEGKVHLPSTRMAYFTPSQNLEYDTTYTVTVNTGVASRDGLSMTEDYQWTFTTEANPRVPPVIPKSVLARGLNSREIGVNWVPAEGAEGYYIERSNKINGPYVRVGSTNRTLDTTFIDRDADPSTPEIQPLPSSSTYFYKIVAYNEVGESYPSANSNHTYTNPQGQSVQEVLNQGSTLAPDSPRGVMTTKGGEAGTVIIRWQANTEPNLLGYNLYRATASGGPYTKINSNLIPKETLEYTDQGLLSHTDYYYRMTAVDLGSDNQQHEGKMSSEIRLNLSGQGPSQRPHGNYLLNDNECSTCHATHTALSANLVIKEGEMDLCFTCHDGTASRNAIMQEFTANYPSRHPVAAGDKPGNLVCSDCHDPHLDGEALDEQGVREHPAILKVDYNGTKFKGNDICYKCHGVDSSRIGGDHETPFVNSTHSLSPLLPTRDTGILCANCHRPHASPNNRLGYYQAENNCFGCHYRAENSSSNPDVYAKLQAGSRPNTRHDLLMADRQATGAQLTCTNCHNPHGVTSQNKLVDPDNPSPSAVWTGMAEPDPDNPLEGTINQFCLRCHDGSPPTAQQTSPYAPGVVGSESLINIEQAFYQDDYDGGDKHGTGDGQPYQIDPAMGYDNGYLSPNYVIACTRCHDTHGSINRYSLRTEITSVDGSEVKSGILVYQWDYRNSKGVAVNGADARFFCSTCHGQKHMGNTLPFPNNCFVAGCHPHGGLF